MKYAHLDVEFVCFKISRILTENTGKMRFFWPFFDLKGRGAVTAFKILLFNLQSAHI
jgi:hypothetical protein